MQPKITKISFRASKLKVDISGDNNDCITIKYGDIFTAVFEDGSDLLEYIEINDAYEFTSIEKLTEKCLDHMYKQSIQKIKYHKDK